MPGFDLEQAIADRQRHSRQLGRAAMVFAGAGWLAVLVVAAAVMWLVALIAEADRLTTGLWMLYGVGATAAFLLGTTVLFYFKPDVDLDVRDESAFDMFTGNRQRAGEAMFGCLLVLPLSTAEGLRDFTQSKGLEAEEIEPARAITNELYAENDWLALERYRDHLGTVANLIRLDIINIKEVHGRMRVRLNPSVMP